VVSSNPTSTSVQVLGKKEERMTTLTYKGLGDYHAFNVPKSDASLLMGLVRSYLLLNGVTPTVPTDKTADVLLYITVDIFGIIRSRSDFYLYNQESVVAETSFEMTAYDRDGKLIMAPKVANHEASYKERYLLWAGPFVTQEKVQKGQGLLVDFADVPARKAASDEAAKKGLPAVSAPPAAVEINHVLGKN
jgi:hypothetical protein